MLPGYFSCNKGLSSSWTFVVEEDTVAGEHAVRLAIVDHHPVGVKFGNAIWGSDLKNYEKKNVFKKPQWPSLIKGPKNKM
jgi:hypothetical protein